MVKHTDILQGSEVLDLLPHVSAAMCWQILFKQDCTKVFSGSFPSIYLTRVFLRMNNATSETKIRGTGKSQFFLTDLRSRIYKHNETLTGLFVYLIAPNTMEQLKGPCEL